MERLARGAAVKLESGLLADLGIALDGAAFRTPVQRHGHCAELLELRDIPFAKLAHLQLRDSGDEREMIVLPAPIIADGPPMAHVTVFDRLEDRSRSAFLSWLPSQDVISRSGDTRGNPRVGTSRAEILGPARSRASDPACGLESSEQARYRGRAEGSFRRVFPARASCRRLRKTSPRDRWALQPGEERRRGRTSYRRGSLPAG